MSLKLCCGNILVAHLVHPIWWAITINIEKSVIRPLSEFEPILIKVFRAEFQSKLKMLDVKMSRIGPLPKIKNQ